MCFFGFRPQSERIIIIILQLQPPVATIPMNFLIDESDYCRNRPNLLAVSLVMSSLDDAHLRQETRQSWGSAHKHELPFGQVFVVGRSQNRYLTFQII